MSTLFVAKTKRKQVKHFSIITEQNQCINVNQPLKRCHYLDWPNVSQKKGFSMRWNCKEWNRRDGMTLMWLLATNPYDSLTFSIDVLLYMYRLITNAFKLIRMNIGASLITFGCLPSHFIYLHPDTSQQIISNQFI